MKFITRWKNVLIGAAIIIIAFIAYSYFFGGTPAPVLSTQPASSTASVDQDLISLLLTLRSIKLDDSLFSDPAFRSLKDFSQALIPEPVGRPNPFAPLGVGAPSAGK